MRRRRFSAIGVALLQAALTLVAADSSEPACTRVLPEPMFPRVLVDPAPLPAVSEPDQFVEGGGYTTTLDGRQFVVLQILQLDLDGDGIAAETIEVEGFWVFSRWWWVPSPRAIHRVPYAGAPWSLWSQDLPPGLAGPVTVEDMDGDGKDDIRTWILSVGAHNLVNPQGYQLLWSDGDQPLTVGQRSHSYLEYTRREDVDGDGIDELLAQYTYYSGVSDREVDEGIIYTALAEDLLIDEPFTWLDVGDVNNDGLDDAIAMTAFGSSNSLGISNGDGTFEVRFLKKPDPYSWPIVLSDIDEDGNLDLWAGTRFRVEPAGFYVAWGRGDATFEPYRFFELTDRPPVPIFADIDGDGHNEMFYPGLGAAFMDGREAGPFVPSSVDALVAFDVDGDDRDDLISRSIDQHDILWSRSIGGGEFAQPVSILAEPLVSRVLNLEATDFDLDGRMDLLVFLSQNYMSPNSYLALRSTGDGRFDPVWEGLPLRGREDVLVDVDADGRPDLVTYKELPELETAWIHKTEIRRGNGLGFDPPMATSWMSFAGPTGRFRTNGVTDMLRIGSFGNSSDEGYSWRDGIFQLELNPSQGYVLERDMAPPVVEVQLVQLGTESGDTWRVATLPVDDCSSTPRVTDRRIAMLDLAPGTVISHERSRDEEVLILEHPLTGRRGVLLRGLNRREMLDRYLEAQRDGGFVFEHMKPMALNAHDDYGDPVPGFPGVHLVQRFTFEEGELTGVSVSRPGGDIIFVMVAEDGVQSAVRSASFLESLPK